MSDGRKIRWMGPKEWRPEYWTDSPLLSPQENRRVEFILKESKKKNGAVALADATWLCGLVKRLVTIAPDDYDFPQYMALVNPIAKNAFALRYKESLLIEHSTVFEKPQSKGQLLDVTTSCQPTEADFVVRPYIRIKPPSDSETVFRLRKSTISMRIDGEPVLRGPIDEHLIAPDGMPFRKHRWKVGKVECLFSAAFLTSDGKAEGVWQGIFCPHGSTIQIDIFFEFEFDRAVTLTAGVVAARYTTKSERPQAVTIT